METGSPVMYHGTDESQFPQRGKEQISNFPKQLTPQEREIFRKCNEESLMYRCLPFSVIGMTATYFAVKRGLLNPNPRWGPAIKMTGAAFMGWFLGKISYTRACQDKFLKLENSYIADVIRKKRGFVSEEFQNEFSNSKPFDGDMSFGDSFSYQSDTDYHSSTGSLNLDVDKNIQYSGFDDRERPTTDREFMDEPEKTEPVKQFTTYEDLRRKNREEYEKLQRPYGSRLDQTPQQGVQRPWSNVDSTPRGYSNPTQGETRSSNQDSWVNSRF